MNTKPLDRRRKYYLVLDCETATLPYASHFDGKNRQRISISKPLIYDLGWKIIDCKGNVYRRKSFLISEIFSVPYVFNTAYYASKRPLYLDKIRKGEISIISWDFATKEMLSDMSEVCAVGAYNAMFDFKKAIAFTEEYIFHLYNEDFHEWEEKQKHNIDYMLEHPSAVGESDFNPDVFTFRENTFPLFDIWGLSCENLLNCDEYRDFCYDNELFSASGKYFKTSAESTYQFIKQNTTFVESHTAIEDADIECEILIEIFKKIKPKDMKMGIIYFPFRVVGRTDL